jgi:uncharacterized membrane protein YfcA
VLLVVLAVFGAGFLNSVGGGGSLISFPALVASGLSPLTANVTNTLALWPGYVGGAASHARRLRRGDGRLRRYAVAAGVGAVAGTAALLLFDDAVFDTVVPYLVMAAAAMLAIPESWLARLRRTDVTAASARPPAGTPPSGLLVIALGGAYGAYFGGALGVVLLAILTGAMGDDLPHANATKNTLTLVINTIALVVFVGLAPVDWTSGAVGAPASLAGALLGGAASTRVNPTHLRYAIVLYALTAGLILLLT